MWTVVEVIIAQRLRNGWSQRSASTLSQPLQGVPFGCNILVRMLTEWMKIDLNVIGTIVGSSCFYSQDGV